MKNIFYKQVSTISVLTRFGTVHDFIDSLFNPSCSPLWCDIRIQRWEIFGSGEKKHELFPLILNVIQEFLTPQAPQPFQRNWAHSFRQLLIEFEKYEKCIAKENNTYPSLLPKLKAEMLERIGNKLEALWVKYNKDNLKDSAIECYKLSLLLEIRLSNTQALDAQFEVTRPKPSVESASF